MTARSAPHKNDSSRSTPTEAGHTHYVWGSAPFERSHRSSSQFQSHFDSYGMLQFLKSTQLEGREWNSHFFLFSCATIARLAGAAAL